MNLKLRFALLLTFFVAIVLIITSTAIFILDSGYRREDFFERLKKDCLEFHDIGAEIKAPGEAAIVMLKKALHSNTSYDEKLVIYDSTGGGLNKLPDTVHELMDNGMMKNIKNLKEWRQENENVQKVWLYIPETHYYVLSSGYDLPGLSKLNNLKIILASVCIGALLLTSVFSFAYVGEAVKPLTMLSNQMAFISEQNLTERVSEDGRYEEINEIARNFNEMLERLHKAFAVQKNFVQQASHELRTPLASMLAQTELALRKNLGEEEYREVLYSLKEDEQRLIELTNSLLLLSQYGQLNFQSDWPWLRIDELLYESISSMKKIYPDIAVTVFFVKQPESDHDCLVAGNDSLLTSVFANLLKNAYNYSFDKKINIGIDIHHRHVEVYFDNRGVHLSPEEAEKIMGPFFRGENAAMTKGFGLGLSIVQRILTVHHGTITYTALYDDTNRFTVRLPKVEDHHYII